MRIFMGISGLTIVFMTLAFELVAFAWLGANDFINPYTMWGLTGFVVGTFLTWVGDR